MRRESLLGIACGAAVTLPVIFAGPINFKPVPKNIDLRALVAQRTSIYERLNQRSAGQ